MFGSWQQQTTFSGAQGGERAGSDCLEYVLAGEHGGGGMEAEDKEATRCLVTLYTLKHVHCENRDLQQIEKQILLKGVCGNNNKGICAF